MLKAFKISSVLIVALILLTISVACNEKFSLNVTVASGQGVVTPSSGEYDDGTLVTLTATPTSGWEFNRWEGSISGSENPSYVRMNADKTIEAYFTESQPTPTPTPAPTITPALFFNSQGNSTVSASGGTVSTTDGMVSIEFPDGAFNASTDVTIKGSACHADTADFMVGATCFSVTPDGELGSLATICVNLSTYDLSIVENQSDLTLAYWADGSWNPAQNVTISGNTICGQTSHLSDWAVIGYTVPAPKITPTPTPTATPSSDLELLQGTWSGQGWTFTFYDNLVTLATMGDDPENIFFTGVVTLNSASNPKTINIYTTLGHNASNWVGKSWLGTYSIDGNNLTLSLTLPNSEGTLAGTLTKQATPPQDSDLELLQGTWSVQGWTFTFHDNLVTLATMGDDPENIFFTGVVTLNSASNPKTIDIYTTLGHNASNWVGKSWLGTYSIDGNTLTLSLAPPDYPEGPEEILAGTLTKQATPPKDSDLSLLQGTWSGQGWTFTFHDNLVTLATMGDDPENIFFTGVVTLNSASNPKTINIYTTLGHNASDWVGKSWLGTYSIDGNTLTLSLALPNSEGTLAGTLTKQ